MVIKPICDQVFVEVDVEERKSPSGLFLAPPQEPIVKSTGIVLDIGDHEVIKVKPGDHVVMEKGMGRRMKLPCIMTNDQGVKWTEYKEHILIAYYDILAVIEGDGAFQVNADKVEEKW